MTRKGKEKTRKTTSLESPAIPTFISEEKGDYHRLSAAGEGVQPTAGQGWEHILFINLANPLPLNNEGLCKHFTLEINVYVT